MPPKQPPYSGRALLVEDDGFLRQAIVDYLNDLGFDVYAAATYQDAADLIDRSHQHLRLAIIDLSLPLDSDNDRAERRPLGLKLVRELKALSPDCGIVIWSAYTHFLSQIMELVAEGVTGLAYVPKGYRTAALHEAIENVLAGNIYLHQATAGADLHIGASNLLDSLPDDLKVAVRETARRWDGLSPRQQDVAAYMMMTPVAIAQELGIEEKTVRNHIDAIYDVLGLKDGQNEWRQLRRELIVVLAATLQRLETEA